MDFIKNSPFHIDKALKKILLSFTLMTIIFTAIIIFLLGTQTFLFFQEVSFKEFFLSTDWSPLMLPRKFGIWPLINGTFLIVLGSLCIAFPFGICIAFYLSEIASKKVKKNIKPFLEILAGIPTIVYGFFGLTFITPLLKQIFPTLQTFNALSGSIVVGVLILPMIASLCDDAFSALPSYLKKGAYALGARPVEVAWGVLFPACRSRIIASFILATSRAVGETMAVVLAAGIHPQVTWNFLEPIQTMTSYIVQASLGDTPAGGIEYLSCFAVGSVLFILTFLMNIVGQRFIKRSYSL